MVSFTKKELENGYLKQGKSSFELSKEYDCSENKINYWLNKHSIPKRTISEAVYRKNNPGGDPFREVALKNNKDFLILGIGLGLYWGEGTKSNKYSVRIGNTDPALLKAFIFFLEHCFSVDRMDLHFGLQVFTDLDARNAKKYWMKCLNVKEKQFYKTTISPSQSKGTYKKRAKHGVLTIYFNNIKMRNLLCKNIEELQRMY